LSKYTIQLSQPQSEASTWWNWTS